MASGHTISLLARAQWFNIKCSHKRWYHDAPLQRVVPWCSPTKGGTMVLPTKGGTMVPPTKCGTHGAPYKVWYHDAPPQRVVPWCSPTKGGTMMLPHKGWYHSAPPLLMLKNTTE